MLKYSHGNLLYTPHEVKVNPVNCVGVMGAGLALDFRKKYPDMFQWYNDLCKHNLIRIGEMSWYRIIHDDNCDFIVNFPTKVHWKDKSLLEYIVSGLLSLRELIIRQEWTNVGIPALGCGLGGLDWQDVKELIEDFLGDIKCNITVYEPWHQR